MEFNLWMKNEVVSLGTGVSNTIYKTALGKSWKKTLPVPPGRMLAVSASSWPQAPAEGCFELVQCISASPLPFVPRVYAPTSGANFHAFLAAGFPGENETPCDITKGWDLSPVETYAPWTFSSAPQDVLTLWRSCETEEP